MVKKLGISFVYFLLHSFITWSIVLTANDSDYANLPLLLVIAYDGLRHDFVNEIMTPTLWSLAQRGVWAPKGLKNQMITLTAPTFQTISTGLYQDKHGIVGNEFYDPEFDEHFDYWDVKNETLHQMALQSKWYQAGEPIWQTNDRHANGRKSGAMRWPLCDAKMNNLTMQYCKGWKDYGKLKDWQQDLDELLSWYDRKDDPINLGLFYICEPDHTQHESDIYSTEVRQKIAELDALTYYLKIQLQKRNLWNRMNIIFTSDHGHANVFTHHNVLNMDNLVNPTEYFWSSKSIFLSKNSNFTVGSLYEKLNAIRMKQPKFQLWLKEDLPEKFHYKNNRRIGPIVVLENLGYVLISHLSKDGVLPPQASLQLWGNHGYSNEYDEMRPFFVAIGPAFESQLIMETEFESVDLYNLMCHVLKIDPAVNDGNFDRVWPMLRNENSKSLRSDFVRSVETRFDNEPNSKSVSFQINVSCFRFFFSMTFLLLLF